MRRATSSSNKRKAAPKSGIFVKKDSFLEKLQMLREFVGSAFEESDLSSSLRQCGYNVEVAAERLMTGEYKPSPKTGGKSGFFSTSSSSTNATASSSLTATPSAHFAKKKRTTPPTSTQISESKTSDSITLGGDGRGRHLLLCQRWLVGLSTSKHGRVNHKEVLALTSSPSGPPMVRFRGLNVEGTLPTNLCAMLSPLLRHENPLISMHSEALMEERGIPIGGEIPISLSVYIEDPRKFFELFHSETGKNTSCSDLFFESSKAARGRKKSKIKMLKAEAAFALLQWAEYGDVPQFETPASNNDEGTESKKGSTGENDTEEEASEEDEEAILLGEDQFNDEAATESSKERPVPEWARNVVDSNDPTASLPEESDPRGLTNGVTLRPYQRQALYWMMRREKEQENREELRNELELLSELASKALGKHTAVHDRVIENGICCECGPVVVSEASSRRSKTIDGQVDPVNHPLWQRRFLAEDGMGEAISFYVNELLGVASSHAPNPPKQCAGGILSDAMGLGKTVMLLSLILKTKETESASPASDMDVDALHDGSKLGNLVETACNGTTLVVTPLSLLGQWEEEIASKTSLSYCVYYGDTVRSGFPDVDVVVTTYGTVQGEQVKKGNGSSTSCLLSHTWARVILDEAHCIKNSLTIVSKACCTLNARSRWCVTGTPIQNSLRDVFGLLKFLRHEPWCESGFWRAAITSAKDYEQQTKPNNGSSANPDRSQLESGVGLRVAIDRVRRLLAPVILRRTKDTLAKDGTPILTLPPVDTATITVTLSPAEREFYNSLLEKSQSVFEGFIKAGTATKSWFAIFSLLQRLRQACDHVALTVKPEFTLPTTSVGKVANASQDVPEETGNDALNGEFLEGLLAKFHEKQSPAQRSDPSRDKENVTSSLYTSKVAHALNETIRSSAATVEDECPICLENPKIHDAVITPCAHIFCRDCLVGFLRDNAARVSPTNAYGASAASLVSCPDGECPCCSEEIKASRIIAMSKSSQDGSTTTTYLISDNRSPSILHVKKATGSSVNLGARQALEDALRGAESAKLTAVINELSKIWDTDHRSKVIIFSQFLGFLNLLETSLKKNEIPFSRLDGKMNLKQRVAVLQQFNKVPSVQSHKGETPSKIGSVLLVSMKAGGVGLNLVAASSVFIVDPWWNEAVEDQCINRIHRIGQTAEIVRVRKFVTRDTVEERIAKLQRRKKAMACDILRDGGNDSEVANSQPTLDDFKILFGR